MDTYSFLSSLYRHKNSTLQGYCCAGWLNKPNFSFIIQDIKIIYYISHLKFSCIKLWWCVPSSKFHTQDIAVMYYFLLWLNNFDLCYVTIMFCLHRRGNLFSNLDQTSSKPHPLVLVNHWTLCVKGVLNACKWNWHCEERNRWIIIIVRMRWRHQSRCLSICISYTVWVLCLFVSIVYVFYQIVLFYFTIICSIKNQKCKYLFCLDEKRHNTRLV